jgi:hypothetical protein
MAAKVTQTTNEHCVLQASESSRRETLRVRNERNNQISFSVADLMTGIYIYKYSINGKLNSTGKLVIE